MQADNVLDYMYVVARGRGSMCSMCIMVASIVWWSYTLPTMASGLHFYCQIRAVETF